MSHRLPMLLKMIEAVPDDAFTLFALAKEYESMENADQALDYYLKLRQCDPDYVGLYYHLGKLYEQLEQTDNALEAYTIGCEVARKLGDTHALSELNGAKMNLEIA
jgi:tetratricopeptide (TPR) repeat protein